ncbi:MAG TPA: hypothetical protein ENF33_00310 [Nitrososphaeria archaeon]|nr:MAG: hypothetical protein DRN68_00395 [Nitrososphaerota archaeon]HDJ66145.1 hypothetical protein [Nitrososphaeria archaeon]
MSAPEESEKVKELARLKDHLERKLSELKNEISLLEKLIELVDEELAEKSFKRAAMVKERTPKKPPETGRFRVLRSRSGEILARVAVGQDELRFIVNPEIGLTRDMRPFSSFLIKKVLDAMSKADKERVERGLLPPGHELSYDIVMDGELVKEIVVRNFREEYRLREIVNAVRWTLETAASAARQSTRP